MENNPELLEAETLDQQLVKEKNNYKQALDEDKQFSIVKEIRMRVKQLEEKIRSLLKNN